MLQILPDNVSSSEVEICEIMEDSVLYNHYLNNDRIAYPRAMQLYKKGLIRDLLLRDANIELEFNELPYNGYIICDHHGLDCHCKTLCTVKNIIGSEASYSEGLYKLARIFYPDINLEYKNDGIGHINISRDSKTQLGKDLWDFFSEKIKVNDKGDYTTLFELSGSLFHNKGKSNLPAVVVDGELIKNSSCIMAFVKGRLAGRTELIDALVENKLPITMYKNRKALGSIGPEVDTDDIWIPELITDIANEIKRARNSTMYFIPEDVRYDDREISSIAGKILEIPFINSREIKFINTHFNDILFISFVNSLKEWLPMIDTSKITTISPAEFSGYVDKDISNETYIIQKIGNSFHIEVAFPK